MKSEREPTTIAGLVFWGQVMTLLTFVVIVSAFLVSCFSAYQDTTRNTNSTNQPKYEIYITYYDSAADAAQRGLRPPRIEQFCVGDVLSAVMCGFSGQTFRLIHTNLDTGKNEVGNKYIPAETGECAFTGGIRMRAEGIGRWKMAALLNNVLVASSNYVVYDCNR